MLSKQLLNVRSSAAMAMVNMQSRAASQHLKAFATIDAKTLSPQNKMMNLVNGEWVGSNKYKQVIDPMTGKPMISIPDTQMDEIAPFVESLKSVPRHGLHNPLKNKERYLMLGNVCRKTVEVLYDQEVFDHFVDLTMRAVPKSRDQTNAEIRVTRAFFENFCGDQVRFLAEAK